MTFFKDQIYLIVFQLKLKHCDNVEGKIQEIVHIPNLEIITGTSSQINVMFVKITVK